MIGMGLNKLEQPHLRNTGSMLIMGKIINFNNLMIFSEPFLAIICTMLGDNQGKINYK